MKFSLNYDIDNCKDCPCLHIVKSFGNDGRDGSNVCRCDKGTFGGIDQYGYPTGLSKIPKVIPDNCIFKKLENHK